jgi:hypothetical protein
LGKAVQINRFGTFAQNRQNGFVALGNCFRAVSLQARRAARRQCLQASNQHRIGEMGSTLDVLADAAVAFAVT